MLGFVAFLSFAVSTAVVWVAVLVQYIVRMGGLGEILKGGLVNVLIFLIALFLPVMMIASALAFIYIAVEMKKNQLIFKDWLASLQKDFVSHEQSIHALIGRQLQSELEERDTQTYPLPFEEKTVMTISKDEPIAKYKDIELPDDIDLHFKG